MVERLGNQSFGRRRRVCGVMIALAHTMGSRRFGPFVGTGCDQSCRGEVAADGGHRNP